MILYQETGILYRLKICGLLIRFKIKNSISVFFLLIGCTGIYNSSAAYTLYIKHGESDCAKCVSVYPTIVRDFPNHKIIVFDNVKDAKTLEAKLSYLENRVTFSNNSEIVKKFGHYSANSLIVYDDSSDWVIFHCNTISYLQMQSEIQEVLYNKINVNITNINMHEKVRLISKINNDPVLISNKYIVLHNVSTNVLDTLLAIDSAFYEIVQNKLNWTDFKYAKNFTFYNSLDAQTKSFVNSPVSILGTSKSADKLTLSFEFIKYQETDANALFSQPHHVLFVTVSKNGEYDVSTYKYDYKRDIDFSNFRIEGNRIWATFTHGNKNRIWHKNIVSLTKDLNSISYKIYNTKRDWSFVKLYGKIKDNEQYFENSMITNNAIVYYFGGYFSPFDGQKISSTVSYGDNLDVINKFDKLGEMVFDEIDLYHDIIITNELKFILLSNKYGHQLHVVSKNGLVAKYLLGMKDLNLSPHLSFANGYLEINMFDNYSGNWINHAFLF